MKKVVLVTVLVLGMAGGAVMAQQGMHMNTTEQGMQHGQGMMHQGQGMMGGGMGMDMMCSRMMGNMSAANQQKFLNDTKELRKQMQMKHFEYMEARRNPNSDPQKINNLEQEMFNLREKMRLKAEKYMH